MSKKYWKIKELDLNFPSDATMTYVNDDGVTITKTLTKDGLIYSARRYFDYTFIDYTGSLKADVINTNFVKWWALNNERFSRIFRAFDEVYNPIENVFKKGHIETTHGHVVNSVDDIDEHKVTTVPNNLESKQYERSSDSGNLEVVAKSESGAVSGDTGGTSKSDAYLDRHSTINSGTDVVEDTTHGNIGVTKSSELLLSEVSARQENIYDMIIDGFFYDNAYCVMDDLF